MTDNILPITLDSTLSAIAPAFARQGDAGLDLSSTEEVYIPQGEHRLVGTGVRIALPDRHAGLVMSRSGLAAKHGIFVLNAPGLVDSGYRGELKVNLANFSDVPYLVNVGDRIAQLVIQKFETPELVFMTAEEFADLGETERGDRGYGSTGYSA
jgi:dUTP pyrophosphatase